MDHLEEISNDVDDFSEKAREAASELRQTLLDPHFVSLLKMQEDVLSMGSYESLYFQKEGQSPIGISLFHFLYYSFLILLFAFGNIL